ncbi:MAG: Gfo/Idh/MocA family oxidoreductase [Planctomycetes bacterium]|nr:Gfo/Idh/MocA family oxidoreductase [Planctomycetota bacterium]
MKLLIIGCGSIGRRHAKNARILGADIALCDLNPSLMDQICIEVGQVPCYGDYLEAIDKADVDAAVVASPSSLHAEMAKKLALRSIHMLVEKPLSHSLDGIDSLLEIVRQNAVTAMMGQSLRFHKGYLTLKDLLDRQAIGKVHHVCACSGWYLPDWHVHEDYRLEYTARRSMGGGVSLTSFSHSFDTFRWLFGEVDKIVGWKANLGNLSIDVEDSAFCFLHTEDNVIITNVADFLSRFPRKDMVITGSEGHIEADFSNNLLKLWRAKEKRFMPGVQISKDVPRQVKILEDGVQYDPNPEILRYDFEPNDCYMDEMTYFFKRVRNRDVEFDMDLWSGLRVLELINNEHFRDLSIDKIPKM